MRWRLDPPIEDPAPVTPRRVLVGIAALVATVLVGFCGLRARLLPLGSDLHEFIVPASMVAGMSVARAVYALLATRLGVPRPGTPAGRRDELIDVAVCTVAGIGCLVLATEHDPWLWPGCLLLLSAAAQHARAARGG